MTPAGYTVAWECYCSDAADDLGLLPERCPEHDRPRMAEPFRNPLPGGVAVGHRCDIGGARATRPINLTHGDLTTAADEPGRATQEEA